MIAERGYVDLHRPHVARQLRRTLRLWHLPFMRLRRHLRPRAHLPVVLSTHGKAGVAGPVATDGIHGRQTVMSEGQL